MSAKKKDNKTPDANWVLRNLVGAVAFVVFVIIVVSVFLSVFTKHGQEVTVPDFTGMTMQEAEVVAAAAGIKVVESDSVYIRNMRKAAVYNQNPKAGESVKKGRRIQLTTNTRVARRVPMPDLVGLSLHQARTTLANRGLVLGKLIYVRDIATNHVLKQQYKGMQIPASQMIEGGSTIDLVLGLDSIDGKTYIPGLSGKKAKRAIEILQDNSLNVGKIVYDRSVRTYADSVNAVVYTQKPESGNKAYIMGTTVSIGLTIDPSKIQQ